MASVPDMREIGSTGLRQNSGYVAEEFLRTWQGSKRNKVIAEMLQDPTVGGTMLAIDQLLRRVETEVEPANDTPAADEVRQFVKECLHDMSSSWADTISEVFSMLAYGWEYSEIVYKRRLGDNKDSGKASKYNDGRIGWRKWPIRSQDSLDRWQFDDEGGLGGMWQYQDNNAPALIPIEKSLLFRTNTFKGNPEGRSILRTAYTSWYYKHNIERVEAIGIERDLAGLPVVYMPPEYLSPDATPAQKALFNTMKDLVTNIRRDEQEGVIFPMMYTEGANGGTTSNKMFELALLTSGGERQFDTDKIIARYDQRIAISMLADFILLGHEQVGSYALSQTKSSLFRTALEAWLGAVAAVINTHAIPRLLRLNGIPLDLAPMVKFGKVGEVELLDVIAFIKEFALAGGTLFPHMQTENHLRRLVGLPQLTEDEFKQREEERKAQEQQQVDIQREAIQSRQQDRQQQDEEMSSEAQAIVLAAHKVLARGG